MAGAVGSEGGGQLRGQRWVSDALGRDGEGERMGDDFGEPDNCLMGIATVSCSLSTYYAPHLLCARHCGKHFRVNFLGSLEDLVPP